MSLALYVALVGGADAAAWGCYGTKPGHPTAAEREAFIREVSALAAIAIAESGYGWTRLALEANNLFAWKYVRESAAGRKAYVARCEGQRVQRQRFVVFASRADAVDFVAGRLATSAPYREHTEAYKTALKRGVAAEPAAKAWLAGIARRYSRKPDEFEKKIIRTMNNPAAPGDVVAPNVNLYRLPAQIEAAR